MMKRKQILQKEDFLKKEEEKANLNKLIKFITMLLIH
jgi:hypothetical protein